MKIFELDSVRVGVIEKKENKKLYRSLMGMIRGAVRNDQDPPDFGNAIYESGLAPKKLTVLRPTVMFSDDAIIISVPQSNHMNYSEMMQTNEETKAFVITKKYRDEQPSDEFDDDEFLKCLSDNDYHVRETSPSCENDAEADEFLDYEIYKLKRAGDVYKYKNVAVAFYYYKHEYYIMTPYVLDDFLQITYKDVTMGREIFPEML